MKEQKKYCSKNFVKKETDLCNKCYKKSNIKKNCEELQWWRGQLHAHANLGPPQLPWTSPDTVVRWYREHQYNFVAMTDLNYLTPVEGLKAVFDAPGHFIVIPGTELSAEPDGVGIRIIDTLGVGVDESLNLGGIGTEVGGGSSTVDVLINQSCSILKAGGLPIIGHPNLTYAITAKDLLRYASHFKGPKFFEVYNAEPGMNNLGGGDKISTEEMWDIVLSAGFLLYGVATDDSHHFYTFVDSRIPQEELSNPGRGWVVVRSYDLTWPSLREAMERGDFYATTGLQLLDYQANSRGIRIALDDRTRDLGWSRGETNPELYTTTFIGKNGKILKIDRSLTPSYKFCKNDLYVRAKIVSSDGYIAWTQPVFNVKYCNAKN